MILFDWVFLDSRVGADALHAEEAAYHAHPLLVDLVNPRSLGPPSSRTPYEPSHR
jgi:hypothetical protein